MIVDGRTIASLIYKEVANEVSHMQVKPHLWVFTCAPNFETKKYLALKRRKAQDVGIDMHIVEFPEAITTDEVVQSIAQARMQADGIIVQLPFPKHIDIETVLQAVPKECDVDGIHYDGSSDIVLPPVVGAIEEVAKRFNVVFSSQKVVIVGRGKLVGAPSEIWCKKHGAEVTVVTKETNGAESVMREAQILILGAGVPGLLTPDKVRDGVIIFDAGTSEDGGVLKGDADPSCARKASLFTPVPGGIGPITVAILLRNLIALAKRH